MALSELLGKILLQAKDFAKKMKHPYVMPEHLVIVLCEHDFFIALLESQGVMHDALKSQILSYLKGSFEDDVSDHDPIESFALQQTFALASQQALNSGKSEISVVHVIAAILELPESYATYFMLEGGLDPSAFLFELCHLSDAEEPITESTDYKETEDLDYLSNLTQKAELLSDPLIGREDILERTIHILCRRYKNNPLHIGEPGVGKSAITLGLAKRIGAGNVPEMLKGAEVFALDLGGMLAGTQYRGDFEKRLKKVFQRLKSHPNPILYIDEIHNIVGAGASGGGSLDASNLIKPYLTEGTIRCIGATTFEEYKKYVEKDKSLVRRFQTIEIKEPSTEETIAILKGLKQGYEVFHGVTYREDALIAAVKLSEHYINDRYLPDKAIDLIDDAGAYVATSDTYQNIVTREVIEEVLSKICHIPKQTVESSELGKVKRLEKELATHIFGQNQAVSAVVSAIKIWAAGLSEPTKPIANMLFVGPTGVGKTEIAKCLAQSLGVKLIRFDMSEYTEKHTASKLIGAPAGYVGYEEGGLLTDAIRKTPYCVLLLDEIEKAHADIFNMLLQVMDYATLTDNQGKKADFRNVVLIMTSNAGASQIGKNLVGFGERMIGDQAITDEVKKIFAPEFRNRLTSMVVFEHISPEIALQIVQKELKYFKKQLLEKHIQIDFTKSCLTYLASKGTSREFGAREIKRIIAQEIKPLIVEDLLDGRLLSGSKCSISYSKGQFKFKITSSSETC